MQRALPAVIVSLLALSPSSALPQASQAQDFMAMTKRPLLYSVQTERVEVRAGLPIGKRSDGTALTIDLYLPKQTGAQTQPMAKAVLRPVALLLHGGLPDVAPVRPGDWRMYKDWGAALAQSGVVTVMVNHSLGYPQRRIDAAAAEIDQVIRWINAESATHRIDAGQLTAIAFSAGGLLIPELVRHYDPGSIRRYALFYPLLGIDANQINPAVVASKVNFADVTALLATRRTPVLIFRSGADEVPGLLARLDNGIGRALEANMAIRLVNLPAAPHAFDSLVDDEQTRGAIGQAIQFAASRD